MVAYARLSTCPTLYVKNLISKRQKSIRRAWPDALDLLLICVEVGHVGIEARLPARCRRRSARSRCQLAEELALTTAELSYLQDRRKAYENLAKRTGLEGVKSVVHRAHPGREVRHAARHRAARAGAGKPRHAHVEAEKKAAALPPKLTVPMILFFLPVLFAVIITPAVIQITSNL